VRFGGFGERVPVGAAHRPRLPHHLAQAAVRLRLGQAVGEGGGTLAPDLPEDLAPIGAAPLTSPRLAAGAVAADD
jgi:hypothetical protein